MPDFRLEQVVTTATAVQASGGSFHVLTITPFYPAKDDPARGCFIAEPLQHLQNSGISNTVLVAQPFHHGRVQPVSSVPAQAIRYAAFPGGYGLPTSGAFLFASLISTVRRIHHAKPIHIIHAHAALPCGHAALLLSKELGIPFVVTVHGLDAFFTHQVSGYFGRWCERVSRWVYRSARRVICISERVRDKVLEKSQAETVVVYNGVDPAMFAYSADVENSDTILSVGNLIPIKGHELLLRALAAVAPQYPKTSCDLIGDGPEHAHLQALARELNIHGKVRFLGRQSRGQVAEAMRRCALFALPSRYEGLGCVYLEAMAAEKAVIGCRGQGIEEVIQHGRNGWLIEPESLSDLTAALTYLLQDAYTRRQMGIAARQTILAGYTLAHQSQALVRLYQGCLA